MNIFDHFNHVNLSQDQQTALVKLESFFKSSDKIFVLKGYAGTGKTTLLAGVTQFLNQQKKQFRVMAPTGRAAKILRDKTGFGATIHRSIYNLDEIEFKNQSEEIEKQSFLYHFPIRDLINETILIVDESSLISSRENKQELFSFGSNILLQDLLTYAKLGTTSNKIIFIGDPAQLPPVGDNKSWVFSKDLFHKKGLSNLDFELTEVKRQSNNLILANAGILRECIQTDHPVTLELKSDNESFIKIKPEDVIDTFIELCPVPEIDNGVIICYSNSQCHQNNIAIRKRIFPDSSTVCIGDVVQIIHNNYGTYGIDVMNGDFGKIIEISNEIIHQSAPVWIGKESDGKSEKVIITNYFRKVKLRVNNEEIITYIFEDLLHNTNKDLTVNQMKSLYINFIIRFDEIQDKREKQGLHKYSRFGIEFKQMLKNDPFYNAIRCKFGYAITCHKAQGGEWKNIIVDFTGRVGLNKDALRWAYTAITRASEKCFAINAPHFNKFSRFEISEIGKITNFPKNALNFKNYLVSPFHNPSQHPCLSKKYWELIEKLEDTDFEIVSISTVEWLEKYQVRYKNTMLFLEGAYNKAGFFKNGFQVKSLCEDEVKLEIETIFNKISYYNTSLNISFEQSSLIELYSIMQNFCNELEIVITNVEHNKENLYVNYYLQTNSVCAYIQFFYNKKFQLTTAIVKSFHGSEDRKLALLVEKLKDYAN